MYDLSTSYSPEGKLYQIEYAEKAAQRGCLSLGLLCKDGIVLAVEKLISTTLLKPKCNRTIEAIDEHCALLSCGIPCDSKFLVRVGRESCMNYRRKFGEKTQAELVALEVAEVCSIHTQHPSLRPVGAHAIIASCDVPNDNAVFSLYAVELSGIIKPYTACAYGAGALAARAEFDALDFDLLTVDVAKDLVKGIIERCRESSKNREYDIEVSWICKQSDYKHEFVEG